jgi:hypothetical protein
MWISVDDRLPEHGVEVPFSWVMNGERYVSFGYRPKDDNYSGWPDVTDIDIDGWPTDRFGVTHWFELPPVPSV